jgi:hypothetical protein
MCLIFWRGDKPIYRNKRKSNVNKRGKVNAGKPNKRHGKRPKVQR